MNKLPFALTSALAVAGASGLVVQQQANARMRDELSGLQTQNQAIVQLQNENARLSRTAAEVAALRDDDAELARLQRETTTLKAQLDNAAAAKRAKEELARSAAAASPTLELSQLDQVPRPTFQKAPVFPAELRKAGVQVAVVVSFVVDSTGSVQNLILTQIKRLPQADGKELDPAVLKSLPMGDFSTAALEAVSQWKFDPGVKGGRMVNTRMQVPIVFNAGPQDVQTGTPTPQEAGSNDIKKTGGWF